jgi:hypothetical protein
MSTCVNLLPSYIYVCVCVCVYIYIYKHTRSYIRTYIPWILKCVTQDNRMWNKSQIHVSDGSAFTKDVMQFGDHTTCVCNPYAADSYPVLKILLCQV